MNSNDSAIYEVIERYLAGTLPEDQRRLFEEQLKSDEVLKQKLSVCKAAQNAILQNKLKSLKSIMAEESSKVDKPGRLNKLWSVVIVALLGGSLFLYFMNRDKEKGAGQYGLGKKSDVPSYTSMDQNSKDAEPTYDTQDDRSETKRSSSQRSVNDPVENTTDNATKLPVVEPADPAADNGPQPVVHSKKDTAKSFSPPPADPCKGVKITAEPVLHEPCAGSTDGFIELKALHGGKSPYAVALNGTEHGNTTLFKDLTSGTYEIKVRDHNGCIHQFNPLILKEKNCVLHYDFNTGRGEEWQGPVVEASRLTIMDKNGKTVYTRQMNDGEQCTWNGYTQSGTLVHGYFVFIIEYKDGKVIKGNITVTE